MGVFDEARNDIEKLVVTDILPRFAKREQEKAVAAIAYHSTHTAPLMWIASKLV